jgi:hypothetical protein
MFSLVLRNGIRTWIIYSSGGRDHHCATTSWGAKCPLFNYFAFYYANYEMHNLSASLPKRLYLINLKASTGIDVISTTMLEKTVDVIDMEKYDYCTSTRFSNYK